MSDTIEFLKGAATLTGAIAGTVSAMAYRERIRAQTHKIEAEADLDEGKGDLQDIEIRKRWLTELEELHGKFLDLQRKYLLVLEESAVKEEVVTELKRKVEHHGERLAEAKLRRDQEMAELRDLHERDMTEVRARLNLCEEREKARRETNQ